MTTIVPENRGTILRISSREILGLLDSGFTVVYNRADWKAVLSEKGVPPQDAHITPLEGQRFQVGWHYQGSDDVLGHRFMMFLPPECDAQQPEEQRIDKEIAEVKAEHYEYARALDYAENVHAWRFQLEGREEVFYLGIEDCPGGGGVGTRIRRLTDAGFRAHPEVREEVRRADSVEKMDAIRKMFKRWESIPENAPEAEKLWEGEAWYNPETKQCYLHTPGTIALLPWRRIKVREVRS